MNKSWGNTETACDPFYKPTESGGISKYVGRIQTLTNLLSHAKWF